MRWTFGIILAAWIAAAWAPAPGRAASRIEWEQGAPSILFQHVEAAGFFGANRTETYLMAELRGRLCSMAGADTALYAVFLDDRDDLSALASLLRAAGSPSAWSAEETAGDGGVLPGDVPCERIRVGTNGGVTILAHEGRHLGKEYVAVVNSVGEILGSRPVWTEAEPGRLRTP